MYEVKTKPHTLKVFSNTNKEAKKIKFNKDVNALLKFVDSQLAKNILTIVVPKKLGDTKIVHAAVTELIKLKFNTIYTFKSSNFIITVTVE